MSVARARKEASRRLGIAMERHYRALAEAKGQEEIQAAAIVLGDCFNTNIEFVINVLKAWGGLEVRFEPLTKPAKPVQMGIDPAGPNGDYTGETIRLADGTIIGSKIVN